MATQVELYKRIKDAMADDAEVVALCDKFISRSDTQNETTKRNRDMVLRALEEMQFDVDGNFTSKEVARTVTLMNAGESWNVRKAASYLSRLVREGVLRKLDGLPKGTPTTYSWAEDR